MEVSHPPDRAKFEQHIAGLLPRLNAYARSLTGHDSDLAKDLVQESIVKGYQSFMANRLELSSRTVSWLATVIRNEFLMHRRGRKRIHENLEEELPDKANDAETANLRHVLELALQELPEDQRDCVVLIDIHRFDYDEAASVLDIPVGTVRSRLSRARLKLAARLSYLNQP